MKKRRKRRFKPWVYWFIFMLFLSIFLATSIHIGKWLYDNHQSKELKKELIDTTKVEKVIETENEENVEQINPPDDHDNDYWNYIKVPLINVDFTELKNKNTDTVAWIQVGGTNINYPVVQATDNQYYLTHAFDKSKNNAGWVFSDYRNDWNGLKENTIIYGHGRRDKTVFGSLKNILTTSWQNNKDNHIVRLSTPTENTLWQVFSVYQSDAESYYLTSTFNGDEMSHQNFLSTIKSRSVYPFSTAIDTTDKILTLSTCADDNVHRIVLHAKLIKKETR